MLVRRLSLAFVAAALAIPSAQAEIYTWTDADGRVHYTQDLQGVPAGKRAEARERAAEADAEPSRVQGYQSAPAARAASRTSRGGFARAEIRGGARVHRIPIERAGSGMIVPVRLNGGVIAPFLVDTGASYVLIPEAVAAEAGIQTGADTRTMQFSTANGMVEHPIVMLDLVELGSAQAEEVPAAISPTMQIGLLGLSFFNRFTYQVDAANGVLTLTENDLAETGALRGGRSETQWRGEFAAMRMREAALDARREAGPSSRSLEVEAEAFERDLELLEAEADAARVPDVWRQ
jgi:clan AA aspartic protease (TIGR02281 family)